MNNFSKNRKLQLKVLLTAIILLGSGYYIHYSAKTAPHQAKGKLFENAYADIQDPSAGK